MSNVKKGFKDVYLAVYSADKSKENIAALKKLYSLLISNDPLKVPDELKIELYQSIKQLPSCNSLGCVSMIQSIIREIPDIGCYIKPPHHHDFAVPVTDLVMSQNVEQSNLQDLLSQAVKWISTVGFEVELQTQALAFITTIAVLNKQLMTKEQVQVISTQIADWLKGNTTTSAHTSITKSGFRQKKIDVVEPFTEKDGTHSGDFFTVLNMCRTYSPELLLNIGSFSSLYEWLLHVLPVDGPTSSTDNAVLKDNALDYCLRLTDQWERKPKYSQNSEVQHSVILEAITILDHVCKVDPSYVPRVIEVVKRVHTVAAQSTSYQPKVILKTLQFFLNHSETVVHDPQVLYKRYFNEVVAKFYQDPAVAFNTVAFLRDNLEKMCHNTNILEKYFPNILKIAAWDPRSYVDDFLLFIPAMMNPNTSIEIFHTLVDLPCMTATLKVMKTSGGKSGEMKASTCQVAELADNPLYKPLFNFIVRNEAGYGDTIDKLNTLHSYLEPLSKDPRVQACAEVVPTYLRMYFRVLLLEGGFRLISQLIPVIMERVDQLFNIPSYKANIRTVLSDCLVLSLKCYPPLLAEQKDDFNEIISSLRHVKIKEDFFIHIVWIIGEYLSEAYDKRCTSDLVIRFYESLECLAYEISSILHTTISEHKAPYTMRLLCVLMTTIAKLASRCQDLIPRVLLCLTKVEQQHLDSNLEEDSRQTLLDRTNDLINLLKLPNIAVVILSPEPDPKYTQLHQDNCGMPVVLQTIKRWVDITAADKPM